MQLEKVKPLPPDILNALIEQGAGDLQVGDMFLNDDSYAPIIKITEILP